MEEFRIRQDGFKEIRKEMLIKALPITLSAAIGGIAINYFSTNEQISKLNNYLFAIPLVLGGFALGIYRGIKRQKEISDSYKLTIDSNCIIREQLNTPTINIAITEVSEISKKSNGGFTIKGNSSVDIINVLSQIDNYEKLEKLLTEIRPISTKNNLPFLQKYNGLLSILTLGLTAGVYISKDKMIVGIAGTVLLTLLGYSLFEAQRSKNIDSKTKKSVWWVVLFIAVLVGIMYFKLTTHQV